MSKIFRGMILFDKELVIFDFDGTLIDSVPDLAGAVNHMLYILGKETQEEKLIREWIGNGAETLVKRALSGSKEIDLSLDEEEFQKALHLFLSYYKEHMCDATYLYLNAKEALGILKRHGKKTAIVTNKPSAFVAPILKKLGIAHLIDFYLGAEDAKAKKPDPAPLLEACKLSGVTIESAIMVGDSSNDIEAAKACGMQSIAVSYGYNYGEDVGLLGADVTIDDLKEIVHFLGIKPKVAVVGGGIAGGSAALHLGELGAEVSLFEKKSSLVDGPPMCHLHAGGNLYREISDEQCVQLLRESIELVRFYPQGIDFRPTVIAIPDYDEGNMEDLLPRLKLLQSEYARLVKEDERNKVLGEVEEYFELFDKEEIEALAKLDPVKEPKSSREWLIPFAKETNLSRIKFPVLFVREFGLNVFRIAASATLLLEKLSIVSLHLQSEVVNVTQEENGFVLEYEKDGKKYEESFDYLVNAAGFQSGKIDDMLGFQRDRFVEFKAAYVTKWQGNRYKWPEVIFHGKRGTPQGMAQFTPYVGGHFQLHGMTKDITLFDRGLVKSSPLSAQPKLDEKFLKKIYVGWSKEPLQERTQRAIEHLSRFIPAFKEAKVAAKPLYGAQQIPGNDDTLRAADFSFEGKRYARCEIVKASSVIAMADAIVAQLEDLGFFPKGFIGRRFCHELDPIKVEALARRFALERGYPEKLALLTTPSGYYSANKLSESSMH